MMAPAAGALDLRLLQRALAEAGLPDQIGKNLLSQAYSDPLGAVAAVSAMGIRLPDIPMRQPSFPRGRPAIMGESASAPPGSPVFEDSYGPMSDKATPSSRLEDPYDPFFDEEEDQAAEATPLTVARQPGLGSY
jgi:hypothetical protein